MTIAETLLPEFDHESASTRKTLERLPEEKFGWKPHEKSMTLGRLAGHIAELSGWAQNTIEKEGLNLTMADYKPLNPSTRQELLDAFDKASAGARAAIAGASNETLMQPWTLSLNGNPMFTMPRIAVLRGMCFNHIIHHRAQLTVYMRLNDIPVPGLYGPSADEQNRSAGA